MKRNSYLTHRAFKQYIFATMMSSVAVQLGAFVDAIIVGNLLGSDGLSAVNLASPAVQLLVAISTLINAGGAILMTKALGSGHKVKAGRIFTFSMVMNLGAGVLFLVLGMAFLDTWVRMLCNIEELQGMVRDYLRVLFIGAPVIFGSSALAVFVPTDSSPKLASVALTVDTVVNLVLDIVLIKYFKMGIAGAPLALCLGFATSFVILLHHFGEKRNHLRFVRKELFKQWWKPFVIGSPLALASFLVSFKIFWVNQVIGEQIGSVGVAIVSVCFNILLISSLFITGISQTMQPICSVAVGCGDVWGQKSIIRTSLNFMSACMLVLTLILLAFPFQIASLFGVDMLEHTGQIDNAIRLFSMSLLLDGINYMIMSVYQLRSKSKLALMIATIQSLMVIPVMESLRGFGESYLWLSFAVAEMLTFFIILLFAMKYPAVPRYIPSEGTLDVSIRHSEKELSAFRGKLLEFLGRQKTISTPEATAEEIMSLVCEYPDWKHSDIIIKVRPDGINLVIKDDGAYNHTRTWATKQNLLNRMMAK